jgi:hypothetical protein
MRIFSQSFSVLGTVSTVPCELITTFTASKMKSDAGSIMSRINSLTDTTGLRSPHNCCGDTGAGSAGALCGGADGLGEEQAERAMATRQVRQVGRVRQVGQVGQVSRDGNAQTLLPALPGLPAYPPYRFSA